MPGGTTVPYKKTKHKTFNAFCRKRFSGQYQIQSGSQGNAQEAVRTRSAKQYDSYALSGEVVWGAQYVEKNKCTFIRKTLNIQTNVREQ